MGLFKGKGSFAHFIFAEEITRSFGAIFRFAFHVIVGKEGEGDYPLGPYFIGVLCLDKKQIPLFGSLARPVLNEYELLNSY